MEGHLLVYFRCYTVWLSLLGHFCHVSVCNEMERVTSRQRHCDMAVPKYEVRVTSEPTRQLRGNLPPCVRIHATTASIQGNEGFISQARRTLFARMKRLFSLHVHSRPPFVYTVNCVTCLLAPCKGSLTVWLETSNHRRRHPAGTRFG